MFITLKLLPTSQLCLLVALGFLEPVVGVVTVAIDVVVVVSNKAFKMVLLQAVVPLQAY